MNQELPPCEKAVNAAAQFPGGHRGQGDNCAAGKQRGMSRVGGKGWEASEKMYHLHNLRDERDLTGDWRWKRKSTASGGDG